MKRFLAVLLAAVISLSSFGVAAFAADNGGISEFSIISALDDLNEKGAQKRVDWFFNENDGCYYLFVPSSMSTDLVTVDYSASGAVLLDGQPLADCKSTTALKDKSEVTLTCGDKSYKLKLITESKVASVFIETESGSLDYIHADKENKEAGKISIFGADGLTVEYAGVLEYIKGRGNSTWNMEKKPYNLKLDKKTNLFGMGKSKKWSLIANHSDTSLIRNCLAYYTAQQAGMPYTPLFTPVDVYINNEYQGAYLLTTRIEVDSTRVNIQNLEDANEEANPEVDIEALPRGGVYGGYSGLLEGTKKWIEIPNDPENITGGYILEMELANRYADEICGFVTTRSQPVIMKSPEYASKAQMEYISGCYQQLEDAIFSGADMNELGKYCNVESLAKLYLLNEWSSNQDAALTSSYFYKPVGDTLYAGPAWDYDIAFGNSGASRFGIEFDNPNKWSVCFGRQYRNTIFGTLDVKEVPTIFNVLTKNQAFLNAAKDCWTGEFTNAVDNAVKFAKEVYVPAVTGSAVANAIRWNIFGTSDVAEIKAQYSSAVSNVMSFSATKQSVISGGIGTIIKNENETNSIVKGLKNILTGINDLFEKVIVILKLENKG